MNKISRYIGIIATAVLTAGGLWSCVADDIVADTPLPPVSSEFAEYDIPGFMTVNLRMGESTRAVSDFQDMAAKTHEYALAPSTDAETYHYALLYQKTGDNDTPVAVLSLDTREVVQDDDNKKDLDLSSDMTLAIKKVYASTDFDEKLKTLDGFKSFLNSINAVYMFVNFDLNDITRFDGKKDEDDKHLFNPEDFDSAEEYFKELSVTSVNQLEVSEYTIKAKNYKGEDCEYFTMTSSIYRIVATGKFVPAFEVNSNNIYYTKENALNGNPAISGLVERLAVKYELEPDFESGKYLKTSNNTVNLFRSVTTTGDFVMTTIPVTWSAEVVGYGVNALEPTTRVLKQMEGMYGGNSDGWNDEIKKRCYWSKDPHYTIEGSSLFGYPHQYRAVIETDTIRGYMENLPLDRTREETLDEITKENPNRHLRYFPYNYFKTDISKPIYSLENTYKDNYLVESKDYKVNGFGPYNYYSAGTHFILACVLRLENQTVRDIYRDEDDLYYTSRNDLLTAKLTLLNDRDLVGGSSDIRVLNVNWGYNTDPTHNYDRDLRVLEWPKGARLYYRNNTGETREVTINDLTLIPAYITNGDGKVLIAPRTNLDGQFLLKSETEEKPISKNELISLFHKTMGAIDYFKNGMMYYCAPVTHFVNQVTKDSWKNTGDVGAVRNNWYKIIVKGVRAPGVPVAVAAQPIIPSRDIDRDYLSSQMIIYRWHEVPKSVPQYPTFQ